MTVLFDTLSRYFGTDWFSPDLSPWHILYEFALVQLGIKAIVRKDNWGIGKANWGKCLLSS